MKNITALSKINVYRDSLVYCSLLFVSCLIIRFYYFPYGIPIVVDGLDYFFYATEIVKIGNLPQNWIVINNGWPMFLSFWFSIIRLEDTYQYMDLQRILTVIISSLTIIPIYFICKNFVNPKYAIIGSLLFGLDPRILLNSFLGSTDPLYIFLGMISLVFLLKNKKYYIYLAFIFASLCTIVRGEGIFFLIAIVTIFFVRNRINFESIKIFIPSISIFLLILVPILLQRIEISGTDGVFLRATTAAVETSIASNTNNYQNIFSGIELFIKYFIWVLIPNYIVMVPFGFILFLKNKTKENNFILIFLVTMSIPALYAYMVPAEDTRYLYFLFPIFSLLSVIALSTFIRKIKLENYFIVGIIFVIFISSIFFYEYKKDDWRMNSELELENVKIAKDIILVAEGVNSHPIESRYIRSMQIFDEWPYFYNQIEFKTKSIFWEKTKSLDEFINQNKNDLTHIIVDDDKRLPEFLRDVYKNEEKYEFLILEKDYANSEFNSKLKMFKIDYGIFNTKYNVR